ncbi:MAG: hypothetical protein ABI703_04190 [Gemmatimonadales bacterium]
MTASASSSVVPAGSTGSSQSPEFGRAAMAILVSMVLLIVALTGILVETTWGHPVNQVEMTPADPGSVARR